MLPEPEFKQAIGVLEMIARDPEQRLAYDARLKFQRDKDSWIAYALEKGEMIGRVLTLEELLGIPSSDKAALTNLEKAELVSRFEELQRRLGERRS